MLKPFFTLVARYSCLDQCGLTCVQSDHLIVAGFVCFELYAVVSRGNYGKGQSVFNFNEALINSERWLFLFQLHGKVKRFNCVALSYKI